jgi:predicted transcriptional regulator
MEANVYSLFKKRGFAETLQILGSFDNGEAIQKEFFKRFEEKQSYYNAYLRVKPYLVENGLINFKCTQEGTKIIYLTDKGLNLLGKLEEIEKIIEEPAKVE